MHLSIIIPTLNEAGNLSRLLPFFRQYIINRKINVIIVDSHFSTDEAEEICQQNDCQYIKSECQQRSIQLNLGAQRSEAEVLMFVHADVQPPGDFFEQIKKSIEEECEAGFFSYQFDDPSIMLKINSYFTQFDGWFAGGGDQCQFIKRTIFEKLGGFNDDWVIMEDFEFFNRWKSHQIKYKIIRSPALVSARKYKHNSWLKVNLINLIAFMKFRLNKKPSNIKAFYKKWL